MNNSRAVLWALIVVIAALAGCSPRRATTFVADDFSGRVIRKAETGFLLPADVAIESRAEDLVADFQGGPDAAKQLLLARTAMYLRGERTTAYERWSRRSHIELREVPSDVREPIDAAIAIETARFGGSTLRVVDAGALDELFEREGLDYLILLRDSALLPNPAGEPIPVVANPDGTWRYADGGASLTPSVRGQLFILGRAQKGLVWQGYVEGSAVSAAAFSPETIEELAAALAADILSVLE